MKAIFMSEIGGRLIEVDRREIEPTTDYYIAARKPIQVIMEKDVEKLQSPISEREHWIMVSKPLTHNDFAVFILRGIE